MKNNLQKRKSLFLERQPPIQTHYYLKAYLEHKDEIPILREAYALSSFWQNANILVYPEELIVGIINSNESVGFHYGCGTYINIEGEEADIVRERAYKYYDDFIDERELLHLESHASSTTWFGGHMVLDYEQVINIGLGGYRDIISNYTGDFYKAMEITLDGIQKFILRLSENVSGELIHILKNIAYNPPKTFHEGLQLCWILHYLDNSDSFGRFDKYLYDLFHKDKLPRERAKELLTDFWIKIEQADQIQNMTLGGEDVYSELTILCIEVTKELAFKGPNLALRVTDTMPKNIWDAALDCIGAGLGLPALYNDKLYTNMLKNHGYDNDYCFAGCSQVMIPGESNFYNDIGMMNIAKIFELTLYNGFDTRINKQVGIKTGSYKNFDEFKQAFFAQLKDACDIQVSFHNKEILYRASKEGYALRSLFTKDCLKHGKGVFEGGARYNNIQLELIGITNAADSLYAVKTAVFDKKIITMDRLIEILKSNWQIGDMRNIFRGLAKFGNDIDEVDNLRSEITEFLYKYLNSKKAPLGGVYMPGEVIFTAHEHCGVVTGATPDGRMAGDILADSAGAAISLNGPTALMNSVLKIPTNYLLTSVVLNMRFLPQTWNNKNVLYLIETFFQEGGMQLQINVFDSEKLIKAQQDPDSYKDIIVRVGGYSDYFVNLSKGLQDEIIKREVYQ